MENIYLDFDKRLNEIEISIKTLTTTLDRLITSHNNLGDTVIKIGKAHDNVTAEMSQALADIHEAIDLALGKAVPMHRKFQSEVERIFRGRPMSDDK